MLFPKTLLKWKEPVISTEAERSAQRHGDRRLMTMIAAICFLFLWVSARLLPVTEMLRLSIGVGMLVLFILLVCLLYRIAPSCVEITEAGISQGITDETTQAWEFRNIAQCEIVKTVPDGRPVSVLVIELKNGDRETIGIAPSVSEDEIRILLQSKGVIFR